MTGLMVCCVLASFLAKEDGITEAEMSEYRAGAIAMAHRKSAELGCSPPGARMKVGPRIATGGGFDGHFLWDVAFSVFWAVRVPEEKFPVASSLDNLYRFAEPDGYIGRQFFADGTPVWSPDHPISFNPPMLAWAELELASSAMAESNRLERVYPLLLRHHQSCVRKFRRPDGLYFGSGLGCGMDDCPRWPHGYTLEQRAAGGIPLVATSINAPARDRWESWVRGTVATNNSWNCQAGWIDMSAAMALDARSLAKMARLVGREDDARKLDGEFATLKEAINRLCWSEDLGFYCDVTKDGVVRRRHLGALWVLVSGVATPERAKRMVRTLFDPDVFYRPVPLASLEKGDPDYRPNDTYFRGPAWPNLNYLAIRGLLGYGYRSEAKRLARWWYVCCLGLYKRTGGVYENLSSECPDRPKEILSASDYAGHGCLTPIAVQALFEREAVSWTDVLAQPAPAVHTTPITGAVQSAFLDGVDFRGRPTRFFVWYGLPSDADERHGVPGVVLVHGGVGTAFDWWVKMWNERGYAAIAMDTCGSVPVPDERPQTWRRHEHSGPAGWGGFDDTESPLRDQWTYHAVSDVILSHTFLRSLKGVDPDRIGITGISWGGYLTCIAAGVDHRYKWAAPVYGCGFYADGSEWASRLVRMGERGRFWLDMWDASLYLPDATCPFLWISGTTDRFFKPLMLQKSAALVQQGSRFCIHREMLHGQRQGAEPGELRAFADHFSFGKPLLPTMTTEWRVWD